jgi:predicted TIM-barrel fold metal-dependent hydrolase
LIPTLDATTFFGSSPAKRADWSLQTLLSILEEHGVEHALTISLRGRSYDFVAGNDETLAASREHPRLWPVATIDPRRSLGCLDEVKRCADAGFAALRFFPDHQSWPLEWLPFLEVCDAVAQTGLPIILPGGVPGQITLAGRLLAPIGLRVLFVGVGYGNMAEALAALRVYPAFFFDTHLLDTPEAIEVLCRNGGAERVVFGSNSPERCFESAQNMVEAADLTPEQRQAVSGGNLRRLLGEASPTWV